MPLTKTSTLPDDRRVVGDVTVAIDKNICFGIRKKDVTLRKLVSEQDSPPLVLTGCNVLDFWRRLFFKINE